MMVLDSYCIMFLANFCDACEFLSAERGTMLQAIVLDNNGHIQ